MGEDNYKNANYYIIDESGTASKMEIAKEIAKEIATAEGIDIFDVENALKQLEQSAELTIESTKELGKKLAKLVRTRREKQEIQQFNKNSFRDFIKKHY